MKNISILLIGLSLLIFGHSALAVSSPDNPKELPAIQSGSQTMNVSTSPELYNLVVNWVNDYEKSDPSMKISVDKISDAKKQSISHLNFIADESTWMVNDKSNWKMVVGRDVIVPVVNAKNPMLNLLHQQGISPEKFALLFNDPAKRNWSAVVPNGKNISVQFYIPNNEEIKSSLIDFTKINVGTLNVKMVKTQEEAIAAVQKDIFAIGFCKLNDLRRNYLSSGIENIKLLPIDKNGNGRIDNFEDIYNNLDEFTHGVWIGKYPYALCNNIYAVSSTKPTDENELAFLSWIMADGQNLLNSNGYCDLTTGEKQANIATLLNTKIDDIQTVNTASSPQSWPIFLTVIVLVGLFALIFFYSRRSVISTVPDQRIQIAPLLIENSIDVPKGLYFDKTHTWAFMEQDGNVKVGMDDFLQHITGKLTRIRMKEAGEKVRKGEKIVTIIRDGKQLNLYAPISGTILTQNKSLLSDSTITYSSPYSDGWLYQIEPKNWLREVQFMLMSEKYVEWLRDEFVRLKDFISASVKSNNLVYAQVILQDGGELTDNVLADLGPEVWEDFQTQFIDTSK